MSQQLHPLRSPCLFSALWLLFFVFGSFITFIPQASAQQTFFTVDSDGSGKSVQINKNRAKLSKLRNDVVVTQNKLREAGPQAKDAADNCNDTDKLRWNGSTWSCLRESDHHMNVFAKDPLPVCASGWVLTTTSTTSLGCNMPEKGPIGPAPTWRKPNSGDNLQIANPDGTWGSSVYIRGDAGDTFTWYVGAYGACSETSCGAGTRTRTVECRQNTFTTVADSKCASPKPTTTTSCHAGWTYSWSSYGSWSSCNSSCTQSRTRSCIRCDGTTVADSYCSGSATDTQSCSGGYTYSAWGSFGSCGSSCTQSRSRSCTRNCDGAAVSCSYCGNVCSDSQSCTGGYAWSAYGSWSSWSSCNSSCTQSRSRSRTCRRNCDGAVVSSGYCSGSATETQSQSCSGGYSYTAWGSYSSCGSSCTQTRTRSCTRNCDGATVSCSYCGGSCSSTISCTGGYSYTAWSSWSSCSASCGGGTQSRTRSCKRGCDGATVSCSYCGGYCSESQSCNTQACSGGGGGCFSCCEQNYGCGAYYMNNACYYENGSLAGYSTQCQ